MHPITSLGWNALNLIPTTSRFDAWRQYWDFPGGFYQHYTE